MFDSYFRVFGFTKDAIGMALRKPAMLAPFALNIALAVPVHALTLLALFLLPAEYQALGQLLGFVAVVALYFIDYIAGGLNTSMVYDEMTTQDASIGKALGRTAKASLGILIFAVVSGIFDMLIQIAQQQRSRVAQMILMFLRSMWSTATYVIMPAMVIEEIGFFPAFKRSKDLMENDPTQVGVGIIGVGLVTSIVSTVCLLAAGFIGFRLLYPIMPALGMGFALLMVNLSWAFASYLKSTYYTCFYLWSRECEKNKGVNPAWAPGPLKSALEGVDFQAMGVAVGAPAAGVAFAAPAFGQAQQGYPQAQQGYPQAQQGYPQAQQGYPQQGYPQAQQGYPQAQQGYPQAQQGYPQAQQGYPQAQQGYPQAQQGYPQAQQGYPQAQQGYPQQGYPQAQQGYPQAQQGYPQAQQGYPQAQQGTPQQGTPQQPGQPGQGGGWQR